MTPRIFCCTYFVQDLSPELDKFSPRSIKCIFVGYFRTQKGYWCYNPSTRICWFHIFWVSSIFLLTASCYCLWNYSSFIIYTVACIITCTYFWWLLARATGRHFEATCIKTSSEFLTCLHLSPKKPASEPAPADPSPRDDPPPQLSSFSDLDIPIAFRNDNRSCTNHSISKFVFYCHLNLTFRQSALFVSSEYIPTSCDEALLVSVWKQAMNKEMDALVSR